MTDVNPVLLDYFKRKESARAARTSILADSSKISPDDAAESVRLGNEAGVPPQAVLAAPERFRSLSRTGKMRDALVNAPKLSDWLGNPINADIAKDDVENLSWFETSKRETKEFGQRVVEGATGMATSSLRARRQKERALASGVQSSAPGFITESERQAERYRFILERGLGDDGQSPMSEDERALYETRLAAAEQAVENWRAVEETGPWMVGNRGSDAAAFAKTLKQWTLDTFGEAPEDDSLWADLSRGIGSFAAFIIPSLFPGGLLATAQLGSDAARMEAYDRAIAAGASEDEANVAAQVMGFVGVTEALPFGAALNRLSKPAQAAIGGILGKFILDYAKGTVEEGVQEGFMGIAQNLIARYTYDPEQEIITDDVGRQVTVGAILGGIFSGGISLVGSAREARFDRDMIASLGAGETAKTIDNIDQVASQSKLKQRSPEKFKEALDAQDLGDFYVPAGDLREYFQAKDTFSDEMLEAWGIDPEQFRDADSSGNDVAVSKSTYAAYIEGTEDAVWFRENAISKDDPYEMSLELARRFNAEKHEVMERALEEVERNRGKELNERASDVKVYDDVFSQLRAAGRTRDVADYEARVWTAFWRTMGERYGADPFDLAQSMGVIIKGPEQQVTRSRGDLDIMLNTLRGDGKALKPKGMGVLEFAKSKGGVRDRGGDVAAMDAPKGLVAESRADILDRESQPSMVGPGEKKGIGLDELGRALIEAGYFPEYMGGQNIDADGTVVDEAAIALEALSEALQGRERYIDGQGPDEALTALSEALSERGIDLDASNDEIAAALEGDGQTYNQTGTLKTDTPEFKAWFGDSKVVDDDGLPLVVYHGTGADFEAFDVDVATAEGGAFYFARNANAAPGAIAKTATSYARGSGQVMPVFLSIANPRTLGVPNPPDTATDADLDAWLVKVKRFNAGLDRNKSEWLEAQIASAKREGHDGLIIRNMRDDRIDTGGALEADIYIAFSPEQIKSVNNRGTFDPNDPRILYQDDVDLYVDLEELLAEFEGVEFAPERSETLDEATIKMQRERLASAAVERDRLVSEIGNRDGFAAWTDGRLKYLTRDGEHSAKPESKFRIGFVDPLSFVAATVDSPARISDEAGSLDVDRLRDDTQTPFIIVKSGEIVGHEGRHRMMAMAKAGVRSAPIVIKMDSGYENSPNKASETFRSQTFVNGPSLDESLEVKDTFAAIYKNKSEIMDRMNQSGASLLYQGQGEKRGSIQLPMDEAGRVNLESGQTVINLFESANLSTFMHEANHFFLEAFTALATTDKAPQGMRDDLAAIHKFLGVKEGQPLTREQHEKWARAGEAYLMEGKAPSLELADAFGRLKAWLTRIYHSIKGLNVKLTPEIREVMDRMLATDAEIAAARETQMQSPLFTDQKAAGMSDVAWATYQRMARRAEEKASQTLLEKTMAKVRREREKWWKAERKDVRKEVEKSVTSQREHRLVEMLANQKWIGSDRDIPDMRLDRDELVNAFGEGVLAELSRSKLGGKRAIYAKGGASLSEVAEFFGFESPSEMVKILQNTGKRKDAIEAETDRVMLDRYGDPLNDGSIEEEAVAAIHSEQQAQTVAAEARHLAAQAGRSTRDMTARVYRQRARMLIGRMTVKDATRPDAFLAAERRAAKGAEDAFARVVRGKSSGEALGIAAKHKEQQLLNHYLYLESRDLTKKVASRREKMRAYSKKTVRAKFGEGKAVIGGGSSALDALHQIDAILEGYDFRKRSPGPIQKTEKLQAFVERMIEDGREAELAIDGRVMDEANRKHYTRLTVDELNGLFDTIDNLDHIGRRWGKLIEAKRKRDLDASAGAFATKISERFGTGKAGEQQGTVGKFFNLLWRADTMLEDIDGAELGVGYTEFKQSIDDGLATEQEMNVAMAEKVESTFSVYSSKELADMQQPRNIPGGNGHMWSKMEVIALALNVGNVEGRDRVLEKTVHAERRLTRDQLDATLDILDKRDWDFVQQLIDDINEYWPQIVEVETRRTGVTPKKVDALPIETKYGIYKGGYYPLKYDPSRSIGAAKDEASLWDQFKASGRGSKIEVNAGMTKSRQKTSGGRTIDYDVTVALQHMRKTIRMIALSEAVDASARILKHPAVETAFMDAGKTDMHRTLRLFLDDIAMGPVYNTDPINSAARFIKNNFTISRLAFNVKTVALQITGIGQSAVVIGNRNMLQGFRDYLARPAETISEVLAKSSFMAERQTTFQKDIYDQANDLKVSSPLANRGTKAKNVISKWGFAPMTKVQFLAVDVPTWVGAYSAELRKGSDETAAIRYADRMVARAQGSGLYGDRNAFERGTISDNTRQSDFIRLWTTLGSYMVTKTNRAYLTGQQGVKAMREAETATGAALAGLGMASDMMLLFMFEAIVIGLANAAMTDDEEPEDVAEFILKETAIATVSGIPIVSGVANALQGYGGGGVLASVLEMPARAVQQLAQGENDKAARRSVADVLGMLTGLPTTQATRLIEGAINSANGDGASPAEMMFGRNPLAD